MNTTEGFYSTGDATNFKNERRRKSVNFRGVDLSPNPKIILTAENGTLSSKQTHQIDRASSLNVLDERNLFKDQNKGLSMLDSFSPIKIAQPNTQPNKKLLSGILEEPLSLKKQNMSTDDCSQSLAQLESDTKLYEIEKLLAKWEKKLGLLDREISTEKEGRRMAIEDL